jgi:hypothetical protein
MNKTNVLALAARLRSPSAEGHFDMTEYFEGDGPLGQAIHECGTIACIAGFAAAMAHPKARLRGSEVHPIARNFLGLTIEEAEQLFVPEGIIYSKVTRFVAADTLEHLGNTGEIQWDL